MDKQVYKWGRMACFVSALCFESGKAGRDPLLAEKGKNMNMLYEAFPGGGHVVILGARASIASTI